MKINTQKISPIGLLNADGTRNRQDAANRKATFKLRIQDHQEIMEALVFDIGDTDILLGHDWLRKHNPEINWNKGRLEFTRCQCTRHTRIKKIETEPLPEYVKPYLDRFKEQQFDQLPPHRAWDVEIRLKPNAPASIPAKIYPMTKEEMDELDEFIEEGIKTGKLKPSKSPYAAPVFFIKKKDGSRRLVQDYRKLNEYTIPDHFPLPRIDNLLEELRDTKWFNKLDIVWGYNNLRIKEGDEWKAAFITPRGLYEPTVMFFGQSGAPAAFMRWMTHIFRDMVANRKIVFYMDDFLIRGATKEELVRNTKEVLDRARKHGIYFKIAKCFWNKKTVEMLGFIVGNGKMEMERSKIQAIQDWQPPAKKKALQRFLGFCNFYRRFIKGYARIAGPLHELTGNKKYEWEKAQQTAFQQLKDAVTKAPVLILPDLSKPFRLETDASQVAIGAVLSQQDQQNQWHPIAFRSRTLNQAERNYDTMERELLAIIDALKIWRHFLLEGAHEVEVLTDHKNLLYLRKPQLLNGRQKRWKAILLEYRIRLEHIPGDENARADALSRKHEDATIESQPEALLDMVKTARVLVIGSTWETKIRHEKDREDYVRRAVIDEPELYQERGGIIYREGRAYVPKTKKLREELLYEYHDTPIAGHPGIMTTLTTLSQYFWWPTIKKDVTDYVNGCQKCQRNKILRTGRDMGNNPHERPLRPWEAIGMDFIGPLPKTTKGYDAILVITDVLGKMIKLLPTTVHVTGEETAKLFLEHIWKNYGLPDKIISDRGTQFTGNFFKELCTSLGITQNLSTAFHPQTDGQNERTHQELEAYLRHFINYQQDDWDKWLTMAEFTHNRHYHTGIGMTPFQATLGYQPRDGLPHVSNEKNPASEEFLIKLERRRAEARASLNYAQMLQQDKEVQEQIPKRSFEPGERVWLETTNIKTKRPMKKLDAKRYGPFKILEKIGPAAYRLEIPENWQIHNVFNQNLLTKWKKPSSTKQEQAPPPPAEIVGGEIEYEVEEILDKRKIRGKDHYLVKWQGYGPEDSTWQKVADLTNAAVLVAKYERKYGNNKKDNKTSGDKTPRRR